LQIHERFALMPRNCQQTLKSSTLPV
jgi:hypothetical protein